MSPTVLYSLNVIPREGAETTSDVVTRPTSRNAGPLRIGDKADEQ